ncbi:hypothetical protein AMS68_002627 [Peltaster fructicola]|uniref:ER-bound oxygenase mpaB/mpaB'/Rubber oxygenase catalytic domain-containing protein n=1 Tax=Peltaster fructicola TaxID=286661 RepID=A0A6H0XRL4_9PEZI|nr:hypothetical protein AMS68_002627 [Peltaster fructicola]
MVITNPFYRRTENTRSNWGHTFELTPEHLSPELYEHLRHTYDVLGEQALDRVNEISPPTTNIIPRNNSQHSTDLPKTTDDSKTQEKKPAGRDVYQILKDNLEKDELLKKFWTEITTVPEWVDWEQIARGQDCFYRYGGANLTGLAYMSLLGGFGAAKIVETLARTGGFSTKIARNRIFETTQYILQCTQSIESLRPDGEAFKSTVRVRLLHASVRHRIMKLAQTRPEYYNVEEYGMPINDLDAIGTIASFSSTLIWLALPRQGIYMKKQEIADYVALWRYIAYMIGAPTEGYFDTVDNARRILDNIMLHEINPSPTSKILASNMIKALAGQAPSYASADFLIASARWMNGNELMDALGLPRPSIYYWALMAGQCAFFCFFSYAARLFPNWDKAKNERLKGVFYRIIVHSKDGLKGQESMFDFKYIPQYSTITEMAEAEEEYKTTGSVEWRNLRSFVILVGTVSAMTLLSAKAVSVAWSFLR